MRMFRAFLRRGVGVRGASAVLVLIVTLGTAPALARAGGDVAAVAGAAGLVVPEGYLDDALEIALALRSGRRAARLVPELWLHHWASDYESPSRFRRLPYWGLSLRGVYFFPATRAARPYVAGAASLEILRRTRQYWTFHHGIPSLVRTAQSDFELGASLMGGLELRLWPRLNGALEMGVCFGEADRFFVRVVVWRVRSRG